MKAPTRKQRAEYAAKVGALSAHLETRPDGPNPETLSRSYGLPLADVERILRSHRNAR